MATGTVARPPLRLSTPPLWYRRSGPRGQEPPSGPFADRFSLPCVHGRGWTMGWLGRIRACTVHGLPA